MPLPYPTKVVLPFDIATAQDMNERHANDVALADGTGLDDDAITTPKIDDGAVTAVKTSFGGNYSTSEVDTGFTWIDGKTIYKKTVDLGSLPNSTTKTVAHGVSGISNVIDIEAAAYTGSEWVGLPYTANPVTNNVTITVSSSDIRLQSWANRSAWTGFATLFYTKT